MTCLHVIFSWPGLMRMWCEVDESERSDEMDESEKCGVKWWEWGSSWRCWSDAVHGHLGSSQTQFRLHFRFRQNIAGLFPPEWQQGGARGDVGIKAGCWQLKISWHRTIFFLYFLPSCCHLFQHCLSRKDVYGSYFLHLLGFFSVCTQ